MSCFLFYLFSFFSYKIGDQEDRTNPAQGGGLAPVGKVGGDEEREWEGECHAKNVYTCM
jgi:hypothetical protein